EECLEGVVYAQDNVLQDLSIDFAIFGHRVLDAGQFSLLLVARDGDTALLPRLATLTNSGVVDMTTQHQGTVNQPLLLRGGFEFVLVSFADTWQCHARLFCLIDTKAAII